VLNVDWTPIGQGSVSITVDRVKCKRFQIPLVPACAITIHKSQGGTYDTVVMQYDKKMVQQLVYVAMSRATSLDGLYMINKNEDHEFYHGRGNNSHSVREIRDECERLERHPLNTITKKAKRFFDNDDDEVAENKKTRVVSHNVQSLPAHKNGIETDEVFRRAEYLALNETWMDGDHLVPIEGYELAHYEKRDPGGTAGGCAIYRSVDSLSTCEPIPKIPEIERLYRVQSGVGDICLVAVNLHGRRLFVLGSIYIHPNVKLAEAQLLCRASMAQYGTSILAIIPTLEVEIDVPIALMGDINIDVNKRPEFAEWLAEEFGLMHHPSALPTTLGGTCVDHIFLRNMNTECMPFISYYSYHNPLLYRLALMKLKIKYHLREYVLSFITICSGTCFQGYDVITSGISEIVDRTCYFL
jgi:hypothetical protein